MRENNINQIQDREKAKHEKAELIEKLNIGLDQKAQIILVALGLKPGTNLSLYEKNDNEILVKDVLAKAGLKTASKEIKKDGIPTKIIAIISVARDQETLDQLLKLYPNKDHEAYGRLMGYPETAIKAHSNKELLLDINFPGIQDNIFPMKFSKAHWQEEMEYLRVWNETIKNYAPATYKKLGGK